MKFKQFDPEFLDDKARERWGTTSAYRRLAIQQKANFKQLGISRIIVTQPEAAEFWMAQPSKTVKSQNNLVSEFVDNLPQIHTYAAELGLLVLPVPPYCDDWAMELLRPKTADEADASFRFFPTKGRRRYPYVLFSTDEKDNVIAEAWERTFDRIVDGFKAGRIRREAARTLFLQGVKDDSKLSQEVNVSS